MKSKQTMIQEIREKCIEFNPSIIDLQFGCKAKKGDEDMTYIGYFLDRTSWGNGEMMYSFLKDDGIIFRCMSDDLGRFPLIGREIRLADILLAISSSKGDEAWEYAIDSLGRFMRDWGESRHEALSRHWDIRNDSLDSQSEDTISFIHSLLFDNKDNI